MQHGSAYRLHPKTSYWSAIFLFLLSASPLISQTTITGKVTDNAGISPEYANVLLLRSTDSSLVKGAIISEKGIYYFNDVDPGNYLIASSMIGYLPAFSGSITVQSGMTDIQIPTLTVTEDITQLEEVTIKTKKPLYVQKIDRLEVNVQSSVTMAGDNALEILEKSPGVIVDRQNSVLNLRGKSGVTVMIDGKLTHMPMTALFGMLESMSASNIEKLELITTPPASFDAEGEGGFINIVLKKNEYEGVTGMVSGTIGYGREERVLLGGNFSIRKKKFNLYGDYNFSHNNGLQYAYGDHTISDPSATFNSSSTVKRDYNVDLHNGRIGFDYYVTPKTVIGLLGTYYNRVWTMESDIDALYMLDPGPDSSSTGTMQEINSSSQYLANFNIRHKINGHHILNFDVDYFKRYSNQPTSYSTSFFQEGGQALSDEELRIGKNTPLNIWVGRLDYTYNVNEDLTIESGIKGDYSYFTNDIRHESYVNESWVLNPFFSEQSNMAEVIQAAYISATYSIDDKTGIKAGLRYEHTLTELYMESADTDISREFNDLFPTVFLSRKLNEDNSVALAYNKRISRPGFFDLAPFVIQLDPSTYITGNVELLPAISSSLKADYSYKKLLVTLQYTRINNSIKRFQPTRLPELDVAVLSSVNLEKEEIYGLSFALPVNITTWWLMQNNINGYINNIESDYKGVNIDISQKRYDFNTSQIFMLPKDFSLELSFFYYSKAQVGVWTNSARKIINFGIQKEISNNWGTLSLNISNILNEPFMDREAIIPELNIDQRLRMDFDTRVIKLSYIKKLGNMNVKSRNNRESGSGEILKRVGS